MSKVASDKEILSEPETALLSNFSFFIKKEIKIEKDGKYHQWKCSNFLIVPFTP